MLVLPDQFQNHLEFRFLIGHNIGGILFFAPNRSLADQW